jgi:uncharacterized protein with von Willebrand factor type A (vWA) domain
MKLKRLWLCVVLMALPATSFAGAAGSGQPLDEVVVQASRSELAKLRNQIRSLEQQFFKRYNAINPNKDYDVRCKKETRAGTRVGRQNCRAAYQNRALENEAQQYLQFMQSNAGGTAEGNPAATLGDAGRDTPTPTLFGNSGETAEGEIEARRGDYQQNMADVTSKDPELTELARQLGELTERYEQMQQQMQKGKSSKK